MSRSCIAFILSLVGLAAATLGAFMLYYFGAPPLAVTESGQNVVSWSNAPSDATRSANARTFRRHHRWSRAGVVLLGLGSFLQLVSLIVSHN
jgi:uncharacterized membrane protein YfcA